MITIIYMQCLEEISKELCRHLNNICEGIEFCVIVPNIVASWQEFALAFINTLNAIKNRKNIARKLELEFYIRFFGERQIHIVLDRYLPKIKCSEGYKILLIYHIRDISNCLRDALNKFNSICSIAPKPNDDILRKFYLNYIKSRINIEQDIALAKVHRIILGIIGCGDVLIKS